MLHPFACYRNIRTVVHDNYSMALAKQFSCLVQLGFRGAVSSARRDDMRFMATVPRLDIFSPTICAGTTAVDQDRAADVDNLRPLVF